MCTFITKINQVQIKPDKISLTSYHVLSDKNIATDNRKGTQFLVKDLTFLVSKILLLK